MEEKWVLYIEHFTEVPWERSVKCCSGAGQSQSSLVVFVPHSKQSLRFSNPGWLTSSRPSVRNRSDVQLREEEEVQGKSIQKPVHLSKKAGRTGIETKTTWKRGSESGLVFYSGEWRWGAAGRVRWRCNWFLSRCDWEDWNAVESGANQSSFANDVVLSVQGCFFFWLQHSCAQSWAAK